MNRKILKYLDYGIDIQIESWSQKFSQYVTHTWKFDSQYIVDFSDFDDAKLILRPIENIANEYPLTKIAAEICGMKEGEMVIPFQAMAWLYFGKNDFCHLEQWKCYKECTEIEYRDYKIVLDKEDMTIRCYVFNEYYREDFNIIKSEKAFDFLRAMHFNIDFSDGEFITKHD